MKLNWALLKGFGILAISVIAGFIVDHLKASLQVVVLDPFELSRCDFFPHYSVAILVKVEGRVDVVHCHDFVQLLYQVVDSELEHAEDDDGVIGEISAHLKEHISANVKVFDHHLVQLHKLLLN